MHKYDEVIEQYHKINPGPKIYTSLRRIDLRLETWESEAKCDLWLAYPSALVDYGMLRISMTNATFVSSFPGLNFGNESWIDVISIRDWQWEGLNYALWEIEDGRALFYCKKVEFFLEEGMYAGRSN